MKLLKISQEVLGIREMENHIQFSGHSNEGHIQETDEAYLVELFEDTNLYVLHPIGPAPTNTR